MTKNFSFPPGFCYHKFMDLKDTIRNMPKAELHRHIEGCVRPGTVLDIASKHSLPVPSADPEEFEKIYRIYEPKDSLDSVLKKFELARQSFFGLDEVERITYETAENAYKKENVRLLELRFGPEFMFGRNGIDWQEGLDVIAGTLLSFEKKYPVLCGLILIVSRSCGIGSAEKTADFALINKKKIIGFDFADSESPYPSRQYAGIAARLGRAGIPITVHSGEEGSFKQVRESVKYLSPRRIGHGVKIADDRSGLTAKLIKDNNILVETNPWSNYLTGAVGSIEEHPIKRFIDYGIKCSVGADDPEILNTDLNKEYALLTGRVGLGIADITACNRNAAAASFLDKDRREQAEKELGFRA